MDQTPTPAPAEPSSADVKAGCAAAYSADLTGLLLGDSYHPGGIALSRRLTDLLGLASGARVLDVASGRGTTALFLAEVHGARVAAVDYSAGVTALAQEAADSRGLSGRVTFTVGDAEKLPCPRNAFDAAVCECALCTFPDKPAAAAEFARVLRPGGRLGITDVTAEPGRLPPELTTLTARIACIADARPLDAYTAILEAAGLRTLRTERHDAALTSLIDQIEARLVLLRMTAPDLLATAGVDIDAAGPVLAAARAAVADGILGYVLVVAQKPPAG